jgi:hypothetical protein
MKSSKACAITALSVCMIGVGAIPAAAHPAPVSKSQARAVAKRINFTSADFPGYTVTPDKETKADHALDKSNLRCLGETAALVDVSSPEFDNHSGYGFSSETRFARSRAVARHDDQVLRSSRGRRCLAQAVKHAAQEGGAPHASVTLTSVSEPSVAGLDAIFGYHIKVVLTGNGRSVVVQGYDITFSRANVEEEFDEIGQADVPLSASNSALATLISRVKQQVPANGLTIS